jgi:protein-tyrosine phosphatase
MDASVDLHFHLLAGVDDGPTDLTDSLELAAEALADGSDTILSTPHVRHDYVTDTLGLREQTGELRAALARARIELRVLCGGELGHEMVWRLGQAELEAVAGGPPGARWVLLEAPFAGFAEDFHDAATELRRRGFGVLIAHPERSADAELDDSAGLRRELAAGSLAQVNAGSLTGDHGPAACTAAFALVAEGLVAIVASDAHGPTRPPALAAARRALERSGCPAAIGRELTVAAPRRLLARGIPRREVLAA